jgi:hypothetical protein
MLKREVHYHVWRRYGKRGHVWLVAYPKDSDGYKVVNCTRAQPVFHRFGCLARGKVISVTVLSDRTTRATFISPARSRRAHGRRDIRAE